MEKSGENIGPRMSLPVDRLNCGAWNADARANMSGLKLLILYLFSFHLQFCWYYNGRHEGVIYVLAGNATMKQVQRDILMNITGQSMEGLNTLVFSAENI